MYKPGDLYFSNTQHLCQGCMADREFSYDLPSCDCGALPEYCQYCYGNCTSQGKRPPKFPAGTDIYGDGYGIGEDPIYDDEDYDDYYDPD